MFIIPLAWKLGKNQGLNLYLQFQVDASESDQATNQKLSWCFKIKLLSTFISHRERQTERYWKYWLSFSKQPLFLWFTATLRGSHQFPTLEFSLSQWPRPKSWVAGPYFLHTWPPHSFHSDIYSFQNAGWTLSITSSLGCAGSWMTKCVEQALTHSLPGQHTRLCSRPALFPLVISSLCRAHRHWPPLSMLKDPAVAS